MENVYTDWNWTMQRVTMATMFGGLLLPVVLLGCGGGDSDLPGLVPVSGVVTLDGKPVGGVDVTFIPVGSTAGGISYGHTDPNGAYELTSNDGRKGAVVGDFKVVCSKRVMPDGSDYVAEPGGLSPLEADTKELLPRKYSEEGATILKATVPAGGGTVDLEVTRR